ncbi:MAG: hypothetical protein ACM37U_15235, partial [Gemmatimonas sp.]
VDALTRIIGMRYTARNRHADASHFHRSMVGATFRARYRIEHDANRVLVMSTHNRSGATRA